MLNKPKFMSPSTNMQECTIDVTASKIPFSCVIDGNEAINAWQIKIYKLNDNTLVLDTNKQTLSSPFFPVDEKNKHVIFNRDLASYISTNTSFINSSEPYYWIIQVWGATGATTISCEEVFYAYSYPVISIQYSQNGTDYSDLTEGQVLNSKNYSFKAQYNQEQNIPLKRYGWLLTDTDSGQVLLDTISHNQIYGTQDNIICSYDGFLNSGNYSIKLYIETQNDLTLTTLPISFSVSYMTTQLSNEFKVEVLKNEPAIMLDWKSAIIIGGNYTGEINYMKNYPIVNYTLNPPNTSVKIPNESFISYDYGATSSLDISEESYIVLSTQLLNSQDRILFIAEGVDKSGNSIMRKLSFESGKFVYILLSSKGVIKKTYTPTLQPCENVWYIIIMSPFLGFNGAGTTLNVTESCVKNGLYPTETLYPSESLYPYFGVWDKLKGGE